MPPAPVRDIRVHPRDNDLIAATHGRGVYIMDRITALQQIGEALKTDVFLFDVAARDRAGRYGTRTPTSARKSIKRPNPPQGAVFDYFLKGDNRATSRSASPTSAGRPSARCATFPRRAASTATTWDLRYDRPAAATGRIATRDR